MELEIILEWLNMSAFIRIPFLVCLFFQIKLVTILSFSDPVGEGNFPANLWWASAQQFKGHSIQLSSWVDQVATSVLFPSLGLIRIAVILLMGFYLDNYFDHFE